MGKKKADSLSFASSSSHKVGIETDERAIKILEKKLGFKKKKNARAKCFADFGLDDIWDIIEKVDGDEAIKATGKGHQEKSKKKSVQKKRTFEPDHDDHDEDLEDIEDDDQHEYAESMAEIEGEGDGEDTDDETGLKEDIYGRLINKQGDVIKVEAPKKAFGPVVSEEVDDQLMRRLRGLMNRLTASNLMAISTDIEKTIQDYSLNQLTLCLSKCINDQLIRDVSLSPQRLICENAMLIAVLHSNIGDEIGGHIVHTFLNQFDQLLNQSKEREAEDSKRLDNTVAFLAYLCACNVFDTGLMFDIMEKLTQQFSDKCIQIILLVLRMIGFVLRRGDPAQMKKMILEIQSQAGKHETRDKRIVFMLEALTAIKNNNINKLNSLNEDGPITSVDIQSLRTSLKNGIRTKTSVSHIPGKYEEVLKSNRWWIKSGVLLEKKTHDEEKAEDDSKPSSSKTDLDDVNERLCSKLRLVTPLRKTIFKALVTCEDYVECCHRLVKIGGKQFIEVINVCLIVALKEKKFNPFYIYLFKHLALLDRKYKLALMYSFRDRINDLERLSSIQRRNLCNLMAELLKRDVIPITVLKTVQFSDLDETNVKFLREILTPLFTSDEQTLRKVLSKVKPKDPFATALRLFISCFLDPKYKEKMIFLAK